MCVLIPIAPTCGQNLYLSHEHLHIVGNILLDISQQGKRQFLWIINQYHEVNGCFKCFNNKAEKSEFLQVDINHCY